MAKDKYRSFLHDEPDNIHGDMVALPLMKLLTSFLKKEEPRCNNHRTLLPFLSLSLSLSRLCSLCICIFAGVARRIIGGDSAKCYKVMGDMELSHKTRLCMLWWFNLNFEVVLCMFYKLFPKIIYFRFQKNNTFPKYTIYYPYL